MYGSNSFLRSWPCQFLTTLLLITGMTVSAAPPAWWAQVGTDGHRVIDPTSTDPNPKVPANIGQAKFMAKRAVEVLQLLAPATAASIGADLVGPGKIIPTWGAPVAGSADAQEQRAPLLVGQLKAIAAPFYQHLHDSDAAWLEAQLQMNRTKDSADGGNFFPWTSVTTDDANRAIATIGQLKAVFSLRFETLDTDGDGLPNIQEIALGTDPNDSDTDNDSLTDGQEVMLGTDPSDSDSDNDGRTDGEEVDGGGNPNNPSDGGESKANPDDSDNDGLLNEEETQRGTDPNKNDTDYDGVSDRDDAIPWDAAAKWSVPESRYAVIEIPDPTGLLKKITDEQHTDYPATDAVVEGLGPNGHIVFSRFDGVRFPPPTIPQAFPWPIYTNFIWNPQTNLLTELKAQAATLDKPEVGARVSHVDVNGQAHGSGIISLEYYYEKEAGQGKMWHPASGPGHTESPISWDKTTGEISFYFPYESNPYVVSDLSDIRYGGALHENTTLPIGRGRSYLDDGSRVLLLHAASPDSLDWPLKLYRGDNSSQSIGTENPFGSVFYCDREGDVVFCNEDSIDPPKSSYKLYPADNGDAIQLSADIYEVHNVVQIADADASPPIAGNPNPTAKKQYAFTGLDNDDFTSSLWVQELTGTPADPEEPASVNWHKITPPEVVGGLSGKAINTRGEILSFDGTKIFTNGKWHPFTELTDATKWGGFKLTQLNNKGMLAGTADSIVKAPNGAITSRTTKPVLLIPVALVDTKDQILDDNVPEGTIITPTMHDVTIEPKSTVAERKEQSIAWIEPHGADDGSNDPDMPQLVFLVSGAEKMELQIRWKLEVIYNRPRGDQSNETRLTMLDEIFVPSKGNNVQPWREQPLSGGSLRIFEDIDWRAALGLELDEPDNPPDSVGFFGGEAKFTYQLLKADGNPLTSEAKMFFSIGAKNPDDAKAKVYIDAQATAADSRLTRLSYAVAKHESKDYNGTNSRYNHFWEGYARRFRVDHGKGEPLWCKSSSERSAGGIGMYQITGNLTSQFAIIPRSQIWNWQKNVDAYIDIVKTGGSAAKGSVMDRFFAAVARTYPNDSEAQIPPTSHSFDGGSYDAWEAGSITLYNGAAGCPSSRLKNASGKKSSFYNPWTYDDSKPIGSRWQYHKNINNYLHEVIQQK